MRSGACACVRVLACTLYSYRACVCVRCILLFYLCSISVLSLFLSCVCVCACVLACLFFAGLLACLFLLFTLSLGVLCCALSLCSSVQCINCSISVLSECAVLACLFSSWYSHLLTGTDWYCLQLFWLFLPYPATSGPHGKYACILRSFFP